jgi:hypothetical protein
MRSIRFSDQVSEEDQMQLRDLSSSYNSNHRRQSDYRINSLPRIKKHHISGGGSGMRTSTSSYGSLHRRPLSALARSHALEGSDSIDEYVSHAKSSRVRSGNHGPRLTHSRPSLSAMRTTSLDDSHVDQGYYLPPAVRPASRARSVFSASRTGSVDGSGIDRLNYQFPANHSLALDPLDTYHHTQQFHASRSGASCDKQRLWSV